MIDATCTWGDGPDVLLVIKGIKMMLHSPVVTGGGVHGLVDAGSVCLTAIEAKSLAIKLLNASYQADELTRGYIGNCATRRW